MVEFARRVVPLPELGDATRTDIEVDGDEMLAKLDRERGADVPKPRTATRCESIEGATGAWQFEGGIDSRSTRGGERASRRSIRGQSVRATLRAKSLAADSLAWVPDRTMAGCGAPAKLPTS